MRTPLLPITLLALCAGPAFADSPVAEIDAKPLNELWINPGFVTLHFQRDKGLNGENYGIGAEYRFSSVASVTGGRFYNSDLFYSNYFGIYYQPYIFGNIRAGLVAGAFNGYPKMRDGGWFPAVIPVLSYERDRLGVNVAIVPSYKDRLYGGVSLQVKLKVF